MQVLFLMGFVGCANSCYTVIGLDLVARGHICSSPPSCKVLSFASSQAQRPLGALIPQSKW